MLVLGLLVISLMSMDPAIRFLAAGAWLPIGLAELHRFARGYRSCRRLRVHADGSAQIADAAGAWHAVQLRPGCVVLDRIAWLWIDAGPGRKFAELLVGNSRKNNEWRRLQVIWRHLGAAT